MSTPVTRGTIALRRWMAEHDVPGRVLARRAGCSYSVVSLAAAGARVPGFEMRRKLRAVIGIDVAEWEQSP